MTAIRSNSAGARPQKYTGKIYGSSWSNGPESDFGTITEARKWAEEYGTTADKCVISDHRGKEVALHMRDTGGNGMRWFKATL